MSKIRIGFIIGLILSTIAPAFAQDRVVNININGIGPAVDFAAFHTVRQVIGHAIGNGLIDRFMVLAYGIEGGFAACVKAAPYTKPQAFSAFVRQLHSIIPNPATTAYTVTLTSRCVWHE